jgi:dGTPase
MRQSDERAAAEEPARDADAWRRDYRSPQMRDRDRILYSASFHRLAYVTQVTAPESGHIFHNRLSHSLKVAQIGRRNADRLLRLVKDDVITGAAAQLIGTIDPDAVEASCLAHDLGHPPFGHIAEDVLRERAANEQLLDRFEGNAQSFRIVTRLAQRARGDGLDLTRQTLDGLLKYPWRHWSKDQSPKRTRERKWGCYDADKSAFAWVRKFEPREKPRELPRRSVEAWIMEWADDLTYAVHDVQDFYRAGLIPLERLGKANSDEMRHFLQLLEQLEAESPGSLEAPLDEVKTAATELLPRHAPSGRYRHTALDRRGMQRIASELITEYFSAFRIESGPRDTIVLRISDPQWVEVLALKALVRAYVIRRPGLAVVQHGQKRLIGELFDFYLSASAAEGGDRRLFSPATRERLERATSHEQRVRLVIDLISGLTEETAIQLHRRLLGGSSEPTLDATAHMA